METETHPSDLLRGEAEAVVLYTILPPLKVLPFEQAGQGAHPAPLSAQESDWSPPGGWGTGDPRSEGIQEHGPRETQSIEERDEWALIWLAYREQSREWAGRCPRNRPPEACVAGMRTWAEELRRLSGERSHWSFLARLTRAGDRAERLREKSTRFLAELADHPFDEDIARQGTVRFYLAALRLHAAYRALAEERGACPDASAFDAAPLSALRIDPYSGKPIRVQALSPGRFALLPHDGKNPAESVEPPPAVFIRCDPNAFRQ
ncbi:MAG: hypothetical protein JXR96_04610 [Deltaproteobacteria bacterium]|nr:hypothetical protein [Deltaproteobacteria bacterium]